MAFFANFGYSVVTIRTFYRLTAHTKEIQNQHLKDQIGPTSHHGPHIIQRSKSYLLILAKTHFLISLPSAGDWGYVIIVLYLCKAFSSFFHKIPEIWLILERKSFGRARVVLIVLILIMVILVIVITAGILQTYEIFTTIVEMVASEPYQVS